MGTSSDIANVAFVFVVLTTAGMVCAFLSALLFPLLFVYRNKVLRRNGAGNMTLRRETSKGTFCDCFLLGVQWCLGFSIVLSLWTGFMLPPVLVSLVLGGLLGFVIVQFN